MQRLADQVFADERSVRVRRVDEVDPELRQPPQDTQRLVSIVRLTPDALARDAHRAEAESIDGEVAADVERAAGRG